MLFNLSKYKKREPPLPFRLQLGRSDKFSHPPTEEKMNHRQRVTAAIRHQPVDRLPIDIGGMRSTGIMAIPYHQLKKHLGITQGDILVFDTMQQLAYVEEPIRQRLGCDVVILDGGAIEGWHDYTLPDGTAAKIASSFHSVPDGEGGEYAVDGSGQRTHHRPATASTLTRSHARRWQMSTQLTRLTKSTGLA
jgi:hypothetical protein